MLEGKHVWAEGNDFFHFQTVSSTGHLFRSHTKTDVYSTQCEVNFGLNELHKMQTSKAHTSVTNSYRERKASILVGKHFNSKRKNNKLIETDHNLLVFAKKKICCTMRKAVMWLVVWMKPNLPWRPEEVKRFRGGPSLLIFPCYTTNICGFCIQLSVRESAVCWVRQLTGDSVPAQCQNL